MLRDPEMAAFSGPGIQIHPSDQLSNALITFSYFNSVVFKVKSMVTYIKQTKIFDNEK